MDVVKRVESGLLFACVLLVAFACAMALQACSSQSDEHVAAKFGDHVITEDEVSAYTEAYRAKSGLQDELEWKSYLTSSFGDAQTWRQEAIRTLADRMLIEDKAGEDGLSVNAEAVDERIAQEKEQAGIASDDDQAWVDYLAGRGQTPEQHRADLEFSDLEQQVFKAELDFTDEMRDEMCDDYIQTNFADQVVARYAAITLPLGEAERARGYLDELKGLEGPALEERFAQLAMEEASHGDSDLESGDLGWDFTYNEAKIDPKLKLRKATLRKGELYGRVLKGTDALRVVLCTDWASFARTPTYSSLESDGLKEQIEGMTMVSSWAAKCMQYLSDLEEAADIKITNMPEGLEYDI